MQAWRKSKDWITNLQLQGEICRSLRVDGSAVEMNLQWALPLDLALSLPQAALYRLEGLTLLECPFKCCVLAGATEEQELDVAAAVGSLRLAA